MKKIKIALTETDFISLVSGKEINLGDGTAIVSIILKDIGYNRMQDIITKLQTTQD